MNTNPLPATFAALGLFATSLLGCVTDASDESDEALGSLEAGLDAEVVLTDATAVFTPASRSESGARKHVSNFKWTGAKATVGMGMGKGIYGWTTGRRALGAVSIVGTDATAQRRRLDWRSGRITDFELSDLDAVATPAAIAMTFGEVQLADASLGVDPAEAEPEALGWRVRVPNVDPSRVRALRSTSFHSDDDGINTRQGYHQQRRMAMAKLTIEIRGGEGGGDAARP